MFQMVPSVFVFAEAQKPEEQTTPHSKEVVENQFWHPWFNSNEGCFKVEEEEAGH